MKTFFVRYSLRTYFCNSESFPSGSSQPITSDHSRLVSFADDVIITVDTIMSDIKKALRQNHPDEMLGPGMFAKYSIDDIININQISL